MLRSESSKMYLWKKMKLYRSWHKEVMIDFPRWLMSAKLAAFSFKKYMCTYICVASAWCHQGSHCYSPLFPPLLQIQTTVHLMMHHVRVDHLHLHQHCLTGTWYADTLLSKVKSKLENICTNIYTQGKFTHTIPMTSRKRCWEVSDWLYRWCWDTWMT